jgi:hypothetical protein
MIGRGIGALVMLTLARPAAVQAQAGLSSGVAHIALIARVAPRASIGGVGPTTETVRRGTLREGTVKVQLSANTGYRLVVVGTEPAKSDAAPSSRLWVRGENGQFEELRTGTAVTVVRGNHAPGGWQPEVNFRTEGAESAQGPQVLPVRYEVRIDPVI